MSYTRLTTRSIALLVFASFVCPQSPQTATAQEGTANEDHYVKVEIKGQLNSRVFKIGGETTGVEISANGVKWELETAGNPRLRQMTLELHGKTAIVTGSLRVQKGVEVPKRWIVRVVTIRVPGKIDGFGNYLTKEGKLRHRLVLKDSQSGFAGVSGFVWTIQPEGKWDRRPFLNDKVRDADRTGKLTAAQLSQLATEFEKYRMLKLPRHLGQRSQVNPHIFSISFGDKEIDLALRGGEILPQPDPKNPKSFDRDRFVSVVRYVQRQLVRKK